MTDQPCKSLVQQNEEVYGDSFRSDLLEQYKLYVQSAENVSARRVASNHYLLSLNAAACRAVRTSVRKFRPGLLDAGFSPLWGFPSHCSGI